MQRIRTLTAATCLAILSNTASADSLGGLAFAETTPVTAAMTAKDNFTVVGTEDLMGLKAFNTDGTVRAIVEIPTGTSAKWEVSKDDPKAVYWEYKKGKPRVVNYLGYPGNYGAIPGTALPKELGETVTNVERIHQIQTEFESNLRIIIRRVKAVEDPTRSEEHTSELQSR